ncbi:MAG TPA: polysaccharide biosynthesis/export family protein, partial [Clostridia bacterium]|nr:polysaccharide biosynthesis/export family protein [Clostridia bacterium]
NGTHALTTSVLSSPMQVTEQLTGPNSQPVVHIPLPGWVWNLERRKQWREALDHWREIDNLVILVELPPASVSEAVLLGSNLPNMLWLTGSGVADAAETRAQLETLRDARCNLVGALLNRQPGTSLKQRFPRWLSGFAVATLLGWVSLNAQAAPVAEADDNPTPGVYAEDAMVPAGTNAYFSVIGPRQRAAWQNRLTLGPGDIINIGLYGSPELTRSECAIAPDGRVSYLEAQDVMATGRTIDELRAELDNQLVKYRRAARTIITPLSFKSKKYFLLGKVMSKGVYTLDRPMTVLEAIARAKGVESGLVDRNVIDLADFQRSFLVRHGKRIPLNFEKLFYQGDLSQNIPIEPGDYIYVPGKEIQEVYVVGEVRLPGPVTYTPDLNIIGAIAARGGYTDRSFKIRVLVVRGPINNPEAIVVDTHAILDGRAPAFKLRPKDIIYVNSRPSILVEEAADLAATAFIQSLITSWVGVDVVSPVD